MKAALEKKKKRKEVFIKRKHFSGTPKDITEKKSYLPPQILQEVKLKNRKRNSMKRKQWIRDTYSPYKLQVGRSIIQSF